MFKKIREYYRLKKFKKETEFTYEEKKNELLIAHRKQKSDTCILQLVHEVNTLASILEREKVNEKDVSSSLLVYPAKLRK